MLRIAICEDEARDAELLENHILHSGTETSLRRFALGKELLDCLTHEHFDLIFLDIYLPDYLGTDLAAHIRKTDANVIIAFTTTSPDYALAGYQVNALKYLLKPVCSKDVVQMLEMAQLLKSRGAVCTVFVQQRKMDIQLDEICYVEVHNHTCHIHTSHEVLECGNTIEEMSALLPPPRFLKCHRSFIVNLDHVSDVNRDFIMKNGDTVYIRGKDLTLAKKTWAEYLFSTARA